MQAQRVLWQLLKQPLKQWLWWQASPVLQQQQVPRLQRVPQVPQREALLVELLVAQEDQPEVLRLQQIQIHLLIVQKAWISKKKTAMMK